MFRAVEKCCAVDFSKLDLPIAEEDAMRILSFLGFRVVPVDLVEIARSRVGASRYQRGARLMDAPGVFDCSSLMKWLYAQRGIWLPWRTIQQIDQGSSIDIRDLSAGDVIFTTGFINYYRTDPSQGVGHVGIATGEGSIVHAANSRSGIVESAVEDFLHAVELRGIRRYVTASVVTLDVPLLRDIETSDDIRWVILQRLATS